MNADFSLFSLCNSVAPPCNSVFLILEKLEWIFPG
jgi:hypothetical protein